MTDPRLHHLARQALARIQLGYDAYESILRSLGAAARGEPWPAILEQLPRRSRSVCLALWGEPPMSAREVHRIAGGSQHSIHQLLLRLMVAGIVRRVAFGRYLLAKERDMPLAVPRLSKLRVRAA